MHAGELEHGSTCVAALVLSHGAKEIRRYLHAIMQSCNQAIRRISLTTHRRGATKPYPLPRRAGQQDSRSLVPVNLVPMFSSDCDGRYVCTLQKYIRRKREKAAQPAQARAIDARGLWSSVSPEVSEVSTSAAGVEPRGFRFLSRFVSRHAVRSCA